ncbi:hypothetical protein [Desulforhopalus sp. IMCC35007]|uniref:hypothetical protein n=1 Tax=Desulforhopalus sp. IMCC35007 TaxID=2569543 RepID=UPI0010AE26CC|nr:hypothetical protein [Desulforhopalus sp. IMCC35007]TKB08863.1 hypothetical protein FCL48_12620 [Desulforhopalus sp. IMCC35007]
MEWFSQGWWYAVEDGENRVKVVDLRFTEIPSTFGQTYHEWDWPFAWTFDLQAPHKKSLDSVLPELVAPLQTLALLTGRIRGGDDWYPTSTGISIGAAVTPEGALGHFAKEQQPKASRVRVHDS